LSLLGRVLLSAIFLMAAVGNKIPHYNQVLALMEEHHVPMSSVALPLAIVFLIVGSVSVILGLYARFGAFLLAVFLALAAYYFHDFWNLSGSAREAQMIHFMKNLSMFGAMLFVMGNGGGAWSIDRRRRAYSGA
jgi:putative oxidoreductase